jgi:hypothetical protein
MLLAGKKLALASLANQRIGVLEQELGFFQTNLQTVGGQAALLMGFGVGGLSLDVPMGTDEAVTFCFVLASCLAMASNMLSVAFSTWCNIYPSTLALCGPEGALSVSRAVLWLRVEYRWAMWLHILGTFFYFIEAGLLSIIMVPGSMAIGVNSILGCALIFLVSQWARIERRFALGSDAPPDQAAKLLEDADTDPTRVTHRQLPMTGHLVKRGHFRQNWNMRYFTLDKGVLRYYKREFDTEAKGEVQIEGKQVVVNELRFEQFKRENSFVLTFLAGGETKSYALYLQAADPKSRDEWIRALRSWGRDANDVADLMVATGNVGSV